MTPLQTIPPWAIAIILCLLIATFTECTSNVATATLFLPVLASMVRCPIDKCLVKNDRGMGGLQRTHLCLAGGFVEVTFSNSRLESKLHPLSAYFPLFEYPSIWSFKLNMSCTLYKAPPPICSLPNTPMACNAPHLPPFPTVKNGITVTGSKALKRVPEQHE